MIRRRARRRLGARGRRCSSRTATRAPRRCGATSPTRSSAPTRVVLTDVYAAGRAAPARASPGRLVLHAVLDAHPEHGRRLPAAPRRPRRARAAPRPARRRRAHARRRRPHHRARRVAGARVVTVDPPGLDPAGLAARLAAAGVPVERDVPVADLTTYRVGGPVAVLAPGRRRRASSPRSPAALADGTSPPLLVVGRGSNLLVADAGFAGLGVVLGRRVRDGRPRRRIRTSCGPAAAVPLPVLARRTAGGRSGRARVLRRDPRQRRRRGPDERRRPRARDRRRAGRAPRSLDLAAGRASRRPGRSPPSASGTARSALGPTEVVTGADVPGGRRRRRRRARPTVAEIVRWRREHQPGGANAGSVFAQPARRLRRPAHRLARAQGPAGRRRGRLGQARQLLPGRGRRHRRRRAPRSWSRCGGGSLDATGIDARPRAAHGRLRRRAVERRGPRVSTRRRARAAASSAAAAPTPPPRRARGAAVAAGVEARVGCAVAGCWSSASSSWCSCGDRVGVDGVAAARRRPRRRCGAPPTSPPAQVDRAAGDPRGRRDGVARHRAAAVDGIEALPYVRRGHGRAASGPTPCASPCTSARPVAWVDGPAGKARGRRHRAGARDGRRRRPPALPQLLGAKLVPPPGGTIDAGRRRRAVAGGLTGLVAGGDRVGRGHRPRRRAPPRAPVPRSASGSRPRSAVKVRAALAVLERVGGTRRSPTSTSACRPIRWPAEPGVMRAWGVDHRMLRE